MAISLFKHPMVPASAGHYNWDLKNVNKLFEHFGHASKYDLRLKKRPKRKITIDDILNARQCGPKGPTKSQQALWDAEDKRKATLTKAQKDSLEKQKEMFQGNF